MGSVKRSKTKRWLSGAALLGGVMAGICGFGGFFFLTKMIHDDAARLPSSLELAWKRGLPISIEDLQRLKSGFPESENAGPIYRQALTEFEKLPSSQINNLWGLRGGNAGQRWLMLKAIASFQPTFQLLKKAVLLPHNDLIGDPPYFPMPSKQPRPVSADIEFGKMAYYIGAGVRSKVRAGDLDSALDDLNTLLIMSTQDSDYSSTAGANWRINAQMSILNELWRAIVRNPTDSRVLDRVETMVHRVRLPDLYKSIQAQTVLGRVKINQIKSLQEVGLDRTTPVGFTKTVDALYQSPGVKEAFDAKYVKAYLKTFDALPADREDWPAIHIAIVKVNKAIAEDASIDNTLSRVLVPVWPGTPLSYALTQTEQRVLLQAISALRQHFRTGKYPSSLPLGGRISIDPFWGLPLKYHVDSGGFTISSPGRDFKDEGGSWARRGVRFQFPIPTRPVRREL